MATKAQIKKQELLRQVAEDTNSTFYGDYSGRFMYGKTCCGISTDDPGYVLSELKSRGFRVGPNKESLGLGVILYWTDIPGVERKEDAKG